MQNEFSANIQTLTYQTSKSTSTYSKKRTNKVNVVSVIRILTKLECLKLKLKLKLCLIRPTTLEASLRKNILMGHAINNFTQVTGSPLYLKKSQNDLTCMNAMNTRAMLYLLDL